MYLPYLRGKQFELIALREFSSANTGNSHITPIIEPVKATYNGLNLAINTFFTTEFKFALILNPTEGDFKREKPKILEALPQLVEHKDKWIPAFILTTNNAIGIIAAIEAYDLSNIMLICKDSIDIENTNIKSLLEGDCITYVVCDETSSRSTNRRLRQLHKHIIRLDDQFNEQKKNADYLSIPEELFTDEYQYYQEEGGFYGFSDYTVLSKNFIDGGMLPYAIAIHLTYQKTDDEVWVRHFVSDTNDSPSNIHGKFYEAAKKARDFFADKQKTMAIEELIQMVTEGRERYPGLGVLKKISIRNHIELINNLLAE